MEPARQNQTQARAIDVSPNVIVVLVLDFPIQTLAPLLGACRHETIYVVCQRASCSFRRGGENQTGTSRCRIFVPVGSAGRIQGRQGTVFFVVASIQALRRSGILGGCWAFKKYTKVRPWTSKGAWTDLLRGGREVVYEVIN